MRLLLYIILFFIAYFVVKFVFRLLNSPSKTTIHNSRMRKKKNNYDNVEDADFTEIKYEEKKNNS